MIEQGTEEWRQARLGKATASRISDVVARTKKGDWGASRSNYAAELVAERLTGIVTATYTNAAMQWGTEKEPDAISAYEFLMNVEVERVGFVPHPWIVMSGASPDGYVGRDGLVEVKCPGTAKHIDTLLGAEIDGAYIKQMAWQMACTGRMWCDFVSYDPRMPESMQLHVTRVQRYPDLIQELEKEVQIFLAEVSSVVDELTARYLKDAA